MNEQTGACEIKESTSHGGRIAVVGQSAEHVALLGIALQIRDWQVTMVPGATRLSHEDPLGRGALAAVREADTVIHLVNPATLTTDLLFTIQMTEMCLPLLVVFAPTGGERLPIDLDILSALLNVKVFQIDLLKDQGIHDIQRWLVLPDREVSHRLCNRCEAVLILEDDPEACSRAGILPPGTGEALKQKRADRLRHILYRASNGRSQGWGTPGARRNTIVGGIWQCFLRRWRRR